MFRNITAVQSDPIKEYEDQIAYESFNDYIDTLNLSGSLRESIEAHGVSPSLIAFIDHDKSFSGAFDTTTSALESLSSQNPEATAAQILSALDSIALPSLEELKGTTDHLTDKFQKIAPLYRRLLPFVFPSKCACTYAEAQTVLATMEKIHACAEKIMELKIPDQEDQEDIMKQIAQIAATTGGYEKFKYIEQGEGDNKKIGFSGVFHHSKDLKLTPTPAKESGFNEENFKEIYNKNVSYFYSTEKTAVYDLHKRVSRTVDADIATNNRTLRSFGLHILYMTASFLVVDMFNCGYRLQVALFKTSSATGAKLPNQK